MYTLFMALTVINAVATDEGSDSAAPAATPLETEVLEIISAAKTSDLARVARRIEGLEPELRRDFPIRVRQNTIEWRFLGEHPADRLSPEMLEYVVSSEAKSYESLIVVDAEQVERARRLGAALEDLRKLAPNFQVEVCLAWSSKQDVRIVRLWDVLSAESPQQRRKFLQELSPTEHGLEAFNSKADKAQLPALQVPARLYITVRMPRKVRSVRRGAEQ